MLWFHGKIHRTRIRAVRCPDCLVVRELRMPPTKESYSLSSECKASRSYLWLRLTDGIQLRFHDPSLWRTHILRSCANKPAATSRVPSPLDTQFVVAIQRLLEIRLFNGQLLPERTDYCSAPRLFRMEWHNLPTKYMPYKPKQLMNLTKVSNS